MVTSTYDVGDVAPLRLTVNPAGSDTLVGVTVRPPTGESRELAAVPNEDRSVWTTALALTEPGVWSTTWRVTGTGAGTETHTVSVGPGPDTGDESASYATTGDLARYLRAAPPADAALLLARAGQRVDELLRCARYLVDADGMPTDPRVAGALRDATCAQAAWLDESGDDTGSGLAPSGWTDVTIGSVRLGGGQSGSTSSSSDGSGSRYAPNALAALRRVGLLSPTLTAPAVFG